MESYPGITDEFVEMMMILAKTKRFQLLYAWPPSNHRFSALQSRVTMKWTTIPHFHWYFLFNKLNSGILNKKNCVPHTFHNMRYLCEKWHSFTLLPHLAATGFDVWSTSWVFFQGCACNVSVTRSFSLWCKWVFFAQKWKKNLSPWFYLTVSCHLRTLIKCVSRHIIK